MKLKEIQRTATFAWSPNQARPSIVTGTAAGTIDANFAANTELELWQLDLLDHSVAGFTPSPAARVETDARFHDLAVNKTGDVVVGALESGVVEAWSATDLSPVAKNSTAHTGAARTVAFNAKEPSKFATGGSQGQVYVWDVSAFDQPYAPGSIPAQRHDDVESVAWNNATAQILASGGNRGFASLWDTRRKREVLHLYYTSATGVRCPISAVQWHPTVSTKLATASMDDNEPVVCIWDLKNANSPEKVLRGHSKGVLSLDWCRQDENLLLSGGRDNATMLWNPEKGEQLGTYPISVEWAFKTQFHPRMPDLFASASFDGKISVQTLQDTHGGAQETAQPDGSDFWESETVMDAVHPNFKLQQAPKWLVTPKSINFGFGGKLVIANNDSVSVKTVRDSALKDQIGQGFSEAIKTKDFTPLITDKNSESLTWKLLSALVKDEEVELPESPLSAETPQGEEEEEELLDFVPQYTPSGSLSLLGSDQAGVVNAVLAGDYDTAVTKLIAAGLPGDALLIATFGDQSLVTRAQNAYLIANADANPYLRAAFDTSHGKQLDLVENSELSAWPSVLRAVLREPESKHLTYLLGKRLVEAGDRENALKIYFAGKNAAAISALWLDELPELEKKILSEGSVTAYVAHVRALQQVVEQIVAVTSKLGVPPITDDGADRLYSCVRDYADIATQQGELELAKLLLDMLPEQFADEKRRVDVATEAPTAATPSNGRAVPGAARPAASRTAPSASASPAGIPPVSIPPAAGVSSVGPTPVAPAAPIASGASPTRRGTLSSGKNRYAPNPYATPTQSASPQPAYQPPAYGISGGLSTAASTAAASVAAPAPPPPPAGPASGRTPVNAASFKGWNDIPELPSGARRTPAAPSRAAPARTAPVTGPPSVPSRTPSSTSIAPPPPVGSRSTSTQPPPMGTPVNAPVSTTTPLSPATPASPAAPITPAAVPTPTGPSSRPSNPYAPKASARAASSKPSPYAPPPGSTPSPVAPPQAPAAARPPSRTAVAPPPRAKATPPPRSSVASPAPAPAPAPAPVPAAVAPPPPRASSVSRPPSSASSTASSVPSAPPSAAAAVLSPQAQTIKDAFEGELARVRPMYEAQFAKLYKDTAKRLHKLYEHLPALSEPAISSLSEISEAFPTRDFAKAKQSLQTLATEETGEWFTGVKRLVLVSEKIPVG